MSRFIQLHLLTSYPPANLNRDDLGRPKTAMMGGALRLRVSSQSLKRAWRTSDIFQSLFDENEQIGIRTKRLGLEWIFPRFIDGGVDEDTSMAWSRDIQLVFGEPEDEKEDNPKAGLHNKQLAFVAPLEKKALEIFSEGAINYLTSGEDYEDGVFSKIEKARKQKDKKKRHSAIRKIVVGYILSLKNSAVDIALFGRMLAASPVFNTEAACQVAHAISVHPVAVEDDFFTAVDDLNKGEEDMGAGHMGETEFAAGLFYQYICIDRKLLKENLGDDTQLLNKTLAALIEATATVAPTGKQNSFASRARASYMLCEMGNQQPRSLSAAYLKPVKSTDILNAAITSLEGAVENMDNVYGPCADRRVQFNAQQGEGSLSNIIDAVTTE